MHQLIAFVLAAAALLGSPGPGIAALVAVGRSHGPMRGLGYFGAMQLGLALSSALSAAGLVALLKALPLLHGALVAISVIYLAWLAWTIASAPVSGSVGADTPQGALTLTGGFLLGAANPKAYLVFASLFGTFVTVQPAFGLADQVTKWAVCMMVMIIADLAWMLAGAALGRITLSRKAERCMNMAMGSSILLAALATLT